MSSIAALETFLLPFHALFAEDGVSEISINSPGEVWVEKFGEMRSEKVQELDVDHLKNLGKLVAQFTDQSISEERPLLSATLPNGYRIQFVFPPACEGGNVALSIRKNSLKIMTFAEYEAKQLFDHVEIGQKKDAGAEEMLELLHQRKIRQFLEQCVLLKRNIVVSGGTSTGKTTFMNAALGVIPSNERLITCEDAREVQLPNHLNKLHLLSSKGGQGRAKVTTQDLIEACLRLRPDRIIVGEVRGAEAFSFLRAINTGHPGSICTVHADSPLMAVEQLKLMVMQAGLGIPAREVRDYILAVVEVIVQLKRGEKGVRYISDIYFRADPSQRDALTQYDSAV